MFGKRNPNWSTDNGQNVYFLQACESRADDLLRVRGFLTLNEVYDMIGLEQTEEGALMGWVGDVEVDFGISGGIGGETPIDLVFNINSTNVFRDNK